MILIFKYPVQYLENEINNLVGTMCLDVFNKAFDYVNFSFHLKTIENFPELPELGY